MMSLYFFIDIQGAEAQPHPLVFSMQPVFF